MEAGAGEISPAPGQHLAATLDQEPSVPSRYGARRFDPRSLGLVLLLHAVIIAALVTAKFARVERVEPAIIQTFDLTAPAPPPDPSPPQPASMPPPPEVSAPSPRLRLQPQPAQVVAAMPDIAAPQGISARTPVAPVPSAPPSSAPAAAPAPPAPVTAPDFSAAQLDNPAPEYPFLSRRAREEGVVLLRVLVTPAGTAGEVRLEQSSGHHRLDSAAMATVRKWRFLPGKRAGQPVEAWALVPVTFTLD